MTNFPLSHENRIRFKRDFFISIKKLLNRNRNALALSNSFSYFFYVTLYKYIMQCMIQKHRADIPFIKTNKTLLKQ